MTDAERNKRFRRARTDAIRRRTAIQRDTAAEIRRILQLALGTIRVTLSGAPTDFQAFQLPLLQREILRILADTGDQAAAAVSTAAGQAWDAGQAHIDGPLEAGGVRIAALAPALDTAQLAAMRAFMTERIRDVTTAAANKINAELGLALIGSQTTGEAIGKIAGILTRGGRDRALTIARTELARTYSVAAHERMLQAGQLLPGLKKQWRRSGKIHSRLNHDLTDGQVRERDELFELANGVKVLHPHHPAAPAAEVINCGCVALPRVDSWEVRQPGAQPFSEDELRRDPRKRALVSAGINGS